MRAGEGGGGLRRFLAGQQQGPAERRGVYSPGSTTSPAVLLCCHVAASLHTPCPSDFRAALCPPHRGPPYRGPVMPSCSPHRGPVMPSCPRYASSRACESSRAGGGPCSGGGQSSARGAPHGCPLTPWRAFLTADLIRFPYQTPRSCRILRPGSGSHHVTPCHTKEWL